MSQSGALCTVDAPAMALSLQHTAPMTTSECPPMYLVTLCTTRWAPRSSGFCRYGLMKVLSTTSHTSGRLARMAAATARMSVICGGWRGGKQRGGEEGAESR